nr:unnamed protein product [Callosobruchus chinensis]CAH7727850.1 unnamed protein product [Callosobruchus chinensis]CAH7742024.1 unnamed protein product [Callosobruchus chinensis]
MHIGFVISATSPSICSLNQEEQMREPLPNCK